MLIFALHLRKRMDVSQVDDQRVGSVRFDPVDIEHPKGIPFRQDKQCGRTVHPFIAIGSPRNTGEHGPGLLHAFRVFSQSFVMTLKSFALQGLIIGDGVRHASN